MSPADLPTATIQNARRLLFAAIEQGRFDSIPQLAAEYKREVYVYLAKSENTTTTFSLQVLLKPLADAIQLLQIIRAHQSAQFRRLALDSLYLAAAPLAQRGRLKLDA